VFGYCDPRTVSLEDISTWRKMIEKTVSLCEAHRCVKIWRAMWKVAASLGYCERDADPSLGVRNRAAPGRSATWTEGEVVRPNLEGLTGITRHGMISFTGFRSYRSSGRTAESLAPDRQ
jgi:hypothetical protein